MTTAEGPAAAHGEEAAYWLRRCHGFRVASEGTRLGTVEDVLYGAELDPAALLIRSGTFIRKLEAISVEDIEAIDPQAQRLLVRLRCETIRTA